jgi:uncharacterized protein with HEPN domain
MSLSSLEYLHHILDEAVYIESQTTGLSLDDFLHDDTLKRAFVRSLEVIGEATKNMFPELRYKYGHVDWKALAGMRDRLIHRYFGIDYELVWDVAINKIPVLRREIQQILEEECSI